MALARSALAATTAVALGRLTMDCWHRLRNAWDRWTEWERRHPWSSGLTAAAVVALLVSYLYGVHSPRPTGELIALVVVFASIPILGAARQHRRNRRS